MINLTSELENVRTVAIAGHVKPDGDCIGSCLGMYLYLTKISNLWAYQYRFSIMPLFICTPILLAAAVGIPFLCYRIIKRQSNF